MSTNAVSESQLVDLPIAEIQESPNNPRRAFDEAALEELKFSVAQFGIQEPLLVRKIETGGGYIPDGEEEGDEIPGHFTQFAFEIVSGHRRYRAAVALGYETVPCLMREGMSDAEAAEAAIIANLQRVDIHPVEEAQAFQDLLEVLGSIPAVAARLSKEQSYVAKTLRLNTLTLPSRDALRGKLISMDHAFLLARLADLEQNAALKWTLDNQAGVKMKVEEVLAKRLERVLQDVEDRKLGEGYHRYTWEPQSAAKLKSWIEGESGIVLSRAPWSLTDEDYLLPDVGPCAECEKNTTANAPLFGDLLIGEATCTDGACFAAKTAGFVQIELRKLGHDEMSKPKVLVPRLSWKYSSVKPSIIPNERRVEGNGRETANPAKLLKAGQWVEAKPGSCTNIRPGVTADWSDDGERGYMGSEKKLRKPGETLQVCIAVGCKAHPKDWEKPKSKGNQPERRDPAAEKRKEAEEAHITKVEREIRGKILGAVLAKLDAAKAIQMLAKDHNSADKWRQWLQGFTPALDPQTLEAFVVFCAYNSRALTVNGYWMMQPGGVEGDRKEIFALAKSVGIDPKQIAAKYFHDAGSIAPASDRLYPKGVPWPKGGKDAATAPTKKASEKKSAKADPKKSAKGKKAAQPTKLAPAARKRIAEALKKRLADRRKKVSK